MKIRRSSRVRRLIKLYDSFRMSEFMDQSIGCRDINIFAMRMICRCFERYGQDYTPYLILGQHGVLELERLAKQGDPVAQANLGQCYKHGLSVDPDEAKAIEWFEKSAAQGYVRGMASLGLLLSMREVPEEKRRGVELLKKAADKGCAPAMCNLGLRLLPAVKTSRQFRKVERMIYRGAEAGVTEGYVGLCNSCMIGREEVARCARMAWEQGRDCAEEINPHEFSYGSIYGRNNLRKFSLSRMPIEELKRKARHDAVAKTYLAYLSLDGHLGLPLDRKLAKREFQQAAKKGVPAAQCLLGECYYRGHGCRENKDKAFYWFSEAAKQNEFQALGWLGNVFYYGEGCKRNYRISVAYHKQASALGNEGATYNLAMRFLGFSKGLRYNPEKAVELLWPLACHGYHAAIYRLGQCYLHGMGVKRDVERGCGLLTVAVRYTDIEELSHYVRSRHGMGYLRFYEAAESNLDRNRVEPSILKMLEEYDIKDQKHDKALMKRKHSRNHRTSDKQN